MTLQVSTSFIQDGVTRTRFSSPSFNESSVTMNLVVKDDANYKTKLRARLIIKQTLFPGQRKGFFDDVSPRRRIENHHQQCGLRRHQVTIAPHKWNMKGRISPKRSLYRRHSSISFYIGNRPLRCCTSITAPVLLIDSNVS